MLPIVSLFEFDFPSFHFIIVFNFFIYLCIDNFKNMIEVRWKSQTIF